MLVNRQKSSTNLEVFAAVKTTKIFCCLDCPCKKPMEKNVFFFHSILDCISHGYRECKVCKPLSKKFIETPNYQYFQWLERLESIPQSYREHPIDSEDQLNAIKKNFETIMGFSLGKYIRIKNTFALLKQPTTFKMNPIIEYQLIDTPIGVMLSCFTSKGLCLLEFIDRKMLISELKKIQKTIKGDFVFKESSRSKLLEKELTDYFSGFNKTFSTQLDPIGTEFQRQVWSILQQIPYGEIISYSEQAKHFGIIKEDRAIASANGSNMISIIIPCHRVIGINGKLVGYGGGIERKRYLLNLEKGTLPLN